MADIICRCLGGLLVLCDLKKDSKYINIYGNYLKYDQNHQRS